MTPEQIDTGARRLYERTLAGRYVRAWDALPDWQRHPFVEAFLDAARYIRELDREDRTDGRLRPTRVVKAVAPAPVLSAPLMERWHARSAAEDAAKAPPVTRPCLAADAIGATIRTRRNELGISLEQLGRMVKRTPGLLSKIETGRTPAGAETLTLIAAALGLEVSALDGHRHEQPERPTLHPKAGWWERAERREPETA